MSPIRVPALSTKEWACSYEQTEGGFCTHLWRRRDGQGEPIAIHSNAAWAPGDPALGVRNGWPARAHRTCRGGHDLQVEEDRWYTAYPFHCYSPAGTPNFPGSEGGAGIDIHPPLPDWRKADGTGERMPVAAFHRHTGNILTRAELGTWFEYRLDRTDSVIQRIPAFDGPRVEDPWLASWVPHDEYHLCRGFMHDLGLWRAERDPAARTRILMYGEDMRVSYTLTEIKQTSPEWVPFSLARRLRDAAPGRSGHPLRGYAWCLRLAAAVLEVAPANVEDWTTQVVAMVELLERIQHPDGWFYRGIAGQSMDQDEPVSVYGFDPRWNWTTTWQIPFAARALWEAARQVPALKPRVRAILARIKRLWEKSPRVPDMYGGAPGLPLYLRVEYGPFARFKGAHLARSMYDEDMFDVFAEAGV